MLPLTLLTPVVYPKLTEAPSNVAEAAAFGSRFEIETLIGTYVTSN